MGVTSAVEMADRLDVWEEGKDLDLLVRVDRQAIAHGAAKRKGKRTREQSAVNSNEGGGSVGATDYKRTMRTAAEGAYRKAITGLTSDLKRFTPDEDPQWQPVSHAQPLLSLQRSLAQIQREFE